MTDAQWAEVQNMFIVQGRPEETTGAIIIVKDTRAEGLATANDFLERGSFVTIVADGRPYTAQTAMTFINEQRD